MPGSDLLIGDVFSNAANAVPDRTAAALGDRGGLSVALYSPKQYQWKDAGAASHPTRDLPPRRFTLPAGASLTLPPWSLTVARGSGPAD